MVDCARDNKSCKKKKFTMCWQWELFSLVLNNITPKKTIWYKLQNVLYK